MADEVAVEAEMVNCEVRVGSRGSRPKLETENRESQLVSQPVRQFERGQAD